MAPTASDGDATRSRLLEATTQLVVERGWGGVSTRSIAERAGVRSGVVHYHFGSIEDLKRIASMSAMRDLFEVFIAAVAEQPPRRVLEELARAASEELGPSSDTAMLMYEVVPAAARDDALAADFRELLARFREAVADSIRRWHPSPAADPEVLAELLGAAVDGLQLHLLADPDLDLPAHLAPLLDLLGPEGSPS